MVMIPLCRAALEQMATSVRDRDDAFSEGSFMVKKKRANEKRDNNYFSRAQTSIPTEYKFRI